MIDFVDLLTAAPWAYVVIGVVAALDALLPVVPSEATVISAGVLAGAGDLSLVLVVAAGAAGAFAGDTSAYLLGRVLRPAVEARLATRAALRRRRAWAERLLQRRGGVVVLGARFVPGGRTAVTVTAGLVAMPAARFAAFAAAAAVVWASYAAAAGFVGGRTFEEHPLRAMLLAFAAAAALAGAVELGRVATRTLRQRLAAPA